MPWWRQRELEEGLVWELNKFQDEFDEFIYPDEPENEPVVVPAPPGLEAVRDASLAALGVTHRTAARP